MLRKGCIFAFIVLAGSLHAQQAPSPAKYPGLAIHEDWIPLHDGVHLAVNLFMPKGARPNDKFPAILEYLPYRKDDWSAQRDYALHSYFVERGYVSARVDIRGTGRSQGQTPDREYSEQEQLDGMEVIAWLARQPWCNGNVGMMGISWGGFNAIQMAARRPPALKAIIAVDATEELFHDDIHYIDGLMHADEFELSMDLQTGITRVPDFPTDEATLHARFDNPPWFLLYLHQQRDGPFWRRASLRPNYERIQIPVFLIGGFLDGYRDTIPRMLESLKVPVKALVGPWNHTFPHDADPGPQIEWREEAVRWWDHWLKGEPNGIMQEPQLQVYMRHWYAPGLDTKEIPGEWRSESWPPRGAITANYYLTSDHQLMQTPPQSAEHKLKCVPSAGAEAGFWWGDLTADQRPADAYSLTYDSGPLPQPRAILGMPVANLEVSSTAKLSDWFVRLSDVAPDGETTLITGGALGGAQRESSSQPEYLEPGKRYALTIPLHFTSWVFPAGHRIRVAISNALWPMIWPTPYPMTTILVLGGAQASRFSLPVVPLQSSMAAPIFPIPQPDPQLAGVTPSGDTWPGKWQITHDAVAQSTTLVWGGDDSSIFPWGKEADHELITYSVADANPAVNRVNGESETVVTLPDRELRWKVKLDLTSDQENFFYKFTRQLFQNGKLIREKTWNETIPRDFQ